MSEKTETVKITGNLKSAYSVTEKDDNGNITKQSNIVTIFTEDMEIEKADGKGVPVDKFFGDLFKDTAKKWQPDWFKEKRDYISIKSSYNIPVKIDETDKRMSFAQFVEVGEIRGAEVIVKCNVKNNVLYPNAILVVKEGEPYDAFKDF